MWILHSVRAQTDAVKIMWFILLPPPKEVMPFLCWFVYLWAGLWQNYRKWFPWNLLEGWDVGTFWRRSGQSGRFRISLTLWFLTLCLISHRIIYWSFDLRFRGLISSVCNMRNEKILMTYCTCSLLDQSRGRLLHRALSLLLLCCFHVVACQTHQLFPRLTAQLICSVPLLSMSRSTWSWFQTLNRIWGFAACLSFVSLSIDSGQTH